MSALELYDRASALGIDFEAGFDDDVLAERVELGLCEGGMLVFAGDDFLSPCAGCAGCDPALDSMVLVARGQEDRAREKYGDQVVDAAIAASLEADGWDPAVVFEFANGWGA